MAKTKMPTTRAATAYGLLSDVVKLTDEEPLRMAMGEWYAMESLGDCVPRGRFPACGTVGCIGGWVQILTGNAGGRVRDRSADAILGISNSQGDELFFDRKLCGERSQQTRAHARRVIAHIRKFQKKYRAQLIAHRLYE